MLFRSGVVAVDHFSDQLLKTCGGRPSQFGFGLAGVAEQSFDLGRAEIPRVNADDDVANKAKAKLGWSPATSFEQLVTEMIDSDYASARRDSLVKLAGFKVFDHHE